MRNLSNRPRLVTTKAFIDMIKKMSESTRRKKSSRLIATEND